MQLDISSKSLYVGVLGLFLFSVWACEVPQDLETDTPDGSPGYYDLKILMTQQIAYLDSLKPQVRKTVQAGNTEPQSQKISNWQTELNMFGQANINRPILKDVYTVQDSSGGGFTYTLYTCLEEDKPVRKLQVKKASGSDLAEEVHVWIKKDNLLYDSAKELVLDLEKYGQGQRITRYQVLGKQASAFGTTLDFQVEGIIEYN